MGLCDEVSICFSNTSVDNVFLDNDLLLRINMLVFVSSLLRRLVYSDITLKHITTGSKIVVCWLEVFVNLIVVDLKKQVRKSLEKLSELKMIIYFETFVSMLAKKIL